MNNENVPEDRKDELGAKFMKNALNYKLQGMLDKKLSIRKQDMDK